MSGVRLRVDAPDIMDQAEEVPRLGGGVEAYCVQGADRVGNGVPQGEKFSGRCVSEEVVVVAPSRTDRDDHLEWWVGPTEYRGG